MTIPSKIKVIALALLAFLLILKIASGGDEKKCKMIEQGFHSNLLMAAQRETEFDCALFKTNPRKNEIPNARTPEGGGEEGNGGKPADKE